MVFRRRPAEENSQRAELMSFIFVQKMSGIDTESHGVQVSKTMILPIISPVILPVIPKLGAITGKVIGRITGGLMGKK